jgi:uncharacterized protein (TIGR00369 family)
MAIQRPDDAHPVEHRFVGFNALVGHRVERWRPGFVEMQLEVRPELCNASGILHGGVLMTLLDSACGAAAWFDESQGKRRYSVTVSFTTQFLQAARLGETLTVLGSKRSGGGRTIFTAESEIRNERGELVASGVGTFRYRSGERRDGGPVPRGSTPLPAAAD